MADVGLPGPSSGRGRNTSLPRPGRASLDEGRPARSVDPLCHDVINEDDPLRRCQPSYAVIESRCAWGAAGPPDPAKADFWTAWHDEHRLYYVPRPSATRACAMRLGTHRTFYWWAGGRASGQRDQNGVGSGGSRPGVAPPAHESAERRPRSSARRPLPGPGAVRLDRWQTNWDCFDTSDAPRGE